MSDEWISWDKFPVPEDVKGIFIKYEDGVYSDRYCHISKKRKYRDSRIISWKFMERTDHNQKSIKAIQEI